MSRSVGVWKGRLIRHPPFASRCRSLCPDRCQDDTSMPVKAVSGRASWITLGAPPPRRSLRSPVLTGGCGLGFTGRSEILASSCGDLILPHGWLTGRGSACKTGCRERAYVSSDTCADVPSGLWRRRPVVICPPASLPRPTGCARRLVGYRLVGMETCAATADRVRPSGPVSDRRADQCHLDDRDSPSTIHRTQRAAVGRILQCESRAGL